MNNLPKAESITHQHILSVINTIILNTKTPGLVRILDAGCGNGKLIAYLHKSLHQLHSDKEFHISGYDVQDHGVQAAGFLEKTAERLSNEIPEIDWTERIYAIQANDEWSFAKNKYNFVISNQVLEHVHNKDMFFANISRNMVDGGHSIHLAPLIHIIHEGHIFLPWAHRIKNYSALYGYIRALSWLGIGKFRAHKKETNCTLDEYAERHADYMHFWTAYSTEDETLSSARRNGLRADFRFSIDFYMAKIRSLLNLSRTLDYKYRNIGIYDAISVKLLRYISSVTLVCEKSNKY